MKPDGKEGTGSPSAKIARFLLRFCIRDRDVRDGILGDLEQEYRAPPQRGDGLRSLRTPYWMAVLGLASGFAAERLRGMRRRAPATRSNANWRKVEMLFETLKRDLRSAARSLRRTPAFTIVAVLTLALGIGATTSVFSVVNGVLLKPLPFSNPDRLAGVWLTAPGMGVEWLNQSTATYFTFRDEARTIEDIGIWDDVRATVTGFDEPEQVLALMVTDGLLPLLGVRPAIGRTFTAADDTPGAAATVLLGYDYWVTHFGSDSTVPGRSLTVDGSSREIVGVMPRGFRFGDLKPDILYPAQFDRSRAGVSFFSYQAVARLLPGVTLDDAQAEMAELIPRAIRNYPQGFTQSRADSVGLSARLRTFRSEVVGNIEPVLWVILGTVTMVLLIACANVANLLLVRAEGRQREIAIRMALGAGGRQVVQGALVENLILGLIGGAGGITLAHAGLGVLLRLAPQNLPRVEDISIDWIVVVFALAIAIVTGLLFGLVPVSRVRNPDLASDLKEGGRTHGTGKEGRFARDLLVVSQLALALVLLVGSGLMVRTMMALSRVNPGFNNAQSVLTFRVMASGAGWWGGEAAERVHSQILDRLADIPGVTSVAATSSITMDGWDANDRLQVQGFTEGADVLPSRRLKWVSNDYFNTMENPILAGRTFTDDEIRGRAPVVVVTANFAAEYWTNPGEALGKFVSQGNGPWREIIGIVGDVHDDGILEPAVPVVYFPLAVEDFWGMNVMSWRPLAYVVRTERPSPATLVPEVRAAVASVDGDTPVYQVGTLDEILAASSAQISFAVVTLGLAAGTALLLGIVGVYGVISYAVGKRTHEIGVRVALGASNLDVSRLVLRHGLTLTVVGLGTGIMAALGLTRLMSTLLYGVTAADAFTYGVVSLGLGAIALVASYLPARRATRVNPVEALRIE